VMRKGARMFGQEGILRYFVGGVVLVPYYTIVAVLWGLLGSFSWKGALFERKVTTGRK